MGERDKQKPLQRRHECLVGKCSAIICRGMQLSPHSLQTVPDQYQTADTGLDVGRKDPSSTAGGNVDCFYAFGKQYGQVSKIKTKTTYPTDFEFASSYDYETILKIKQLKQFLSGASFPQNL